MVNFFKFNLFFNFHIYPCDAK